MINFGFARKLPRPHGVNTLTFDWRHWGKLQKHQSLHYSIKG